MDEEGLRKYYCSIHGQNGNPNCLECINNLKRLCEDNNTLLLGDLE